MAFGGGSLESQVKILRQRIAQKDQQVTTLLNEAQKKQDAYDELQRLKDTAAYNGQQDAARAKKTEDLLAAKIAELGNYSLRLDNLNSTLVISKEQIVELEKENKRLQRNHSNSQGEASYAFEGLQKENDQLKAKTKIMEVELRRAENASNNQQASATLYSDARELVELRKEVQRLRSESRKISLPGSPAAAMLAMRSAFAAPPASPSPRGKRTKSFSGQPDPQTDSLRAQLADASKDIDLRKKALANVKRELLKTENEKLALERSLGREVETLKDKLEASNAELRHLRSEAEVIGDGSGGMERALGNAQRHRDAAEQRVSTISLELAAKEAEVLQLKSRIEALEGAISTQRAAADDSEAELTAARADAEAQSVEQSTQLERMRAELQAFNSHEASPIPVVVAAAAANSIMDKTVRQLQRELASSKREREALEENLRESDDLLATQETEIARLRRANGFGGDEQASTGIGSEEEIARLQQQISESLSIRADLEASVTDGEKRIIALAARLQAAQDERGESQNTLEGVRATLEASQADQATISSERDAMLHEVQTVKNSLAKQVEEVKQLQACLQSCEERIEQLDRDMGDAQDTAARMATGYEENLGSLADKQATLQQQLTASEALLRGRSHSDAKFEALAADHADTTCRLAAVEATLSEMTAMDSGNRQQIATLTANIEAWKLRCHRFETTISELRSEMSLTAEQLQEEKDEMLFAKHDLEERLKQASAELQEAQRLIADRPSQTDSQQRELDIIQLREDKDGLEQQIEQMCTDLEVIESLLLEKNAESARHAEEKRNDSGRLAECATTEAALRASLVKVEQVLEEVFGAHREGQRLLAYAESERIAAAQAHQETQRLLSSQTDESQLRCSQLEEAVSQLKGEATAILEAKAEAQVRLDQAHHDLEAAGLSIEDAMQDAQSSERQMQATAAIVETLNSQLSTVSAERDQLSRLVQVQDLSPRGMADVMEAEVLALTERIGRREQTIATEQARARKIAFNLELAEQSIIDHEERTVGYMRARDDLATQVADWKFRWAEKEKGYEEHARLAQAAMQDLGMQALRQENDDQDAIRSLVLELARISLAARTQNRETRDLRERLSASNSALGESQNALLMKRESMIEAQSHLESACDALAQADAERVRQSEVSQARSDEMEATLDTRTVERDLYEEQCQTLSTRLEEQKVMAQEEHRGLESSLRALTAEVLEASHLADERALNVAASKEALLRCEERLSETAQHLESRSMELRDLEKVKAEDSDRMAGDLTRLEDMVTQLQFEVESLQANTEAALALDEVRKELEASQSEAERLGDALEMAALDGARQMEQLEAEVAASKKSNIELQENMREQERLAGLMANELVTKLKVQEQERGIAHRASQILEGQVASLREEVFEVRAGLQTGKALLAEQEESLKSATQDARAREANLLGRVQTVQQELRVQQEFTASAAEASQRMKLREGSLIERLRTAEAEFEHTKDSLASSLARVEHLKSDLVEAQVHLSKFTEDMNRRLRASTDLHASTLRREAALREEAERQLEIARYDLVVVRTKLEEADGRLPEIDRLSAASQLAGAELLELARERDDLREKLESAASQIVLLEASPMQLESSDDANKQLENSQRENSRLVDEIMVLRKERKLMEKRIGQQERKLRTAEGARDAALQQAVVARPPISLGDPARKIASTPSRAGILTPRSTKLQSPMPPVSGHKRGREISTEGKAAAMPVFAPVSSDKGRPTNGSGIRAAEGDENAIAPLRIRSSLIFGSSPRR